MIYYGEFLTKEKEEGALVKKLYADRNEELFVLLSNYHKPSDYDALKQGIYDLIHEMPEYQALKNSQSPPPATYPPKSILEAIELLE